MKRAKLLTVTLAATAIMLAFTGCGSKDDNSASGKEAETTVSASSLSKEAQEKSLADEDLSKYVTLGDYKGIEYTDQSHVVTDEELQNEINMALDSMATEEEVTDRAVENGDIVNIDFVGKKDGVAFEGGTSSEGGYDLTIGSHSFIDGFEDGLIGAEIGETRDLDLTFPDNYGSEELAGQAVVFTVSVNSIKVKNVPELTDEIAVSLNAACSSAEEFREMTREDMQARYDEQALGMAYEDLMTIAADNAEVKEVPEWLIEQLNAFMISNVERMAQNYGMDLEGYVSAMGETMEQFNEESRQYSEEEASRLLVVYAIADAEGLKLTDEEIAESFAEYLIPMGVESAEEAVKTVDGKGMLGFFQLEKVEKFLYENANIVKAVAEETVSEN